MNAKILFRGHSCGLLCSGKEPKRYQTGTLRAL